MKPGEITWYQNDLFGIPMDLRGIAQFEDTSAYVAGGMLANQTVTDHVYRIQWEGTALRTDENSINRELQLSPNPASTILRFSGWDSGKFWLYEVNGHVVQQGMISDTMMALDVSKLHNGMYLLVVEFNGNRRTSRFIVHH